MRENEIEKMKETRDIKFRFWDEEEKQFHYGNLYALNYGYLNKEVLLPEYPTMQYSGMPDKHGKDIYEWDIVKLLVGREEIQKETWTVQFKMGSFQLVPKDQFGCIAFVTIAVQLRENKVDGFYSIEDVSKFIEVIGNVFEHPNLIN